MNKTDFDCAMQTSRENGINEENEGKLVIEYQTQSAGIKKAATQKSCQMSKKCGSEPVVVVQLEVAEQAIEKLRQQEDECIRQQNKKIATLLRMNKAIFDLAMKLLQENETIKKKIANEYQTQSARIKKAATRTSIFAAQSATAAFTPEKRESSQETQSKRHDVWHRILGCVSL